MNEILIGRIDGYTDKIDGETTTIAPIGQQGTIYDGWFYWYERIENAQMRCATLLSVLNTTILMKAKIRSRWIPVYFTPPPDKELFVMDEFGNTAYATPSFPDFEVLPGDHGHFSGEIVPTEPYFDGWLIRTDGLDNPLKGKVTYYMDVKRPADGLY